MDGYVTIGTELDTKSFESQIAYVESQLQEIEDKVKQADMGFDVGDTIKLESQYEKLSKQLERLRQKQIDLNKVDLKNAEKSISKIGDATGKTIKKIGRWILAIFSIRSAYSFVARSMSTLNQYNEQIAADTEYIRFAVASALQPAIERLIFLTFQLLSYINSISVAWFGINLFANATTDAMNKTSRAAEKTKKALAGFDEMNILNNDGTTGSLGGTPSVDLSQINPSVIEKNKNFWNDIFKFWEEDWEKFFSNVGGNWDSFIYGLGLTGKGFYDIFKGILEAIGGLFDILVAVFKGDIEKMEEGWKKLADGFVNIIVGALELIVGVILTILGTIKGIFLDLVQGIYDGVIKPIGELFGNLWNGIVDGVKNTVREIKNIFYSIVSFFGEIIDLILGFFKKLGISVGTAIGNAFKSVVNGVLGAIENILNTPIKSINKLINVINKVPGINLGTLPTFNLPRLAVGGIVNMPGRGVPVGGAIAGEAGVEGVIPLTDTQAMETLGATIGKYISISATVPVYVGNRQIAREIKKINADNDFAANR